MEDLNFHKTAEPDPRHTVPADGPGLEPQPS